MNDYKDIEKRKRYQRQWPMSKYNRNKTSVEPIIDICPELTFSLQFKKWREFRAKHNLSEYSNWLFCIRKVNKEFEKCYENYRTHKTKI
jgi:hypothetical protein